MHLLPIGRFARITGLTVRAVRHYGALGLLEPALVDPENGYRYYTLAQAQDAEAIKRLRSLGVPLGEIGGLLRANDAALRDGLCAHRARLEQHAAETAWILAQLNDLIEGKEALVPEPGRMIRFELNLEEEVPEIRAVIVRDRARADELSVVIPRAIEEAGGHLKQLGVMPVGPPFCVCPFPDEDGTAEVETGWPVAGDVPVSGRVELVTYPATRALVMKHEGPYERLSASYKLMQQVMEDNGLQSAGAPRELYLSDPEVVTDPNDNETRIVWPIGAEGELKPPTGDFFMKRVEVPAD